MKRSHVAFDVGDQVLCDGAPAVVRMETATQVLVHLADSAVDLWVPKKAGRLAAASDAKVRTNGNGGAMDAPSHLISHEPAGSFPEPASPDSQREEDDECCVCGNGGKLTCCDVCPRVYHLRCLPPADAERLRQPSATEEDWWCPRCRKLSQVSFCMFRIASDSCVPAAPASASELAQRLFEYTSQPQYEDSWEAIREAGAGLLGTMACAEPWRAAADAADEVAAVEGDAALIEALGQRQGAVGPEWLRDGGLEPAQLPARGRVGEGEGLGDGAGDGEGLSAAGPRRTSEYRGVSRRYGRWKARIKQNGHDIVIGDFDNELDAAHAYDRKALELHGEKAQLNFPG